MVTLVSSDGVRCEVTRETAEKSGTLFDMLSIGSGADAGDIDLSNVSGQALRLVVEYLQLETDAEYEQTALKYDDMNHDVLCEIVMSANYLQIDGLFQLVCKVFARRITGLPVQEIREMFHITCDLTKEEIEEIEKEHTWAFA